MQGQPDLVLEPSQRRCVIGIFQLPCDGGLLPVQYAQINMSVYTRPSDVCAALASCEYRIYEGIAHV